MATIFRSSSSKSSEASSSSHSPKSLPKEEINPVDTWKIPKHRTKDIYKDSIWNLASKSDYTIKTVEETILLNSEYTKIRLLPPRELVKLRKKYSYLHLGLVQVAAKPLTQGGLDTPILLCLRDCRLLNFNDSLLGMAETNLRGGPVYFDCFPNSTVLLQDRCVLDSLTLNVKITDYKAKTGSPYVAILYRVQYKAMNSPLDSRALKTMKIGETVYFQPDLPRSGEFVTRSISWNEVTPPDEWTQPEAAPEVVSRIGSSFRRLTLSKSNLTDP